MRNITNEIVFSSLVILSLAACVAPVAKYYDASIGSKNADTLVILPFVDHRKDKSIVLLLQELELRWPEDAYRQFGFLQNAQKILEKKKGYNTRLSAYTSDVGKITSDDLEDEKPTWISRVGPKNAKHMLLIVLEDLVVRTTFGVAASAECTAYMVDKTTGNLLLKREAIGEWNQGGLYGMFDADKAPFRAVWKCVDKVYEKIPSKIALSTTPK